MSLQRILFPWTILVSEYRWFFSISEGRSGISMDEDVIWYQLFPVHAKRAFGRSPFQAMGTLGLSRIPILSTRRLQEPIALKDGFTAQEGM